MWFHNTAANEMIMGFYGLSNKQGRLDFMFPERIVSKEELRWLNFSYFSIERIGEEADHITCHADGTFHIKTIGGKEIYRDTMKRQEPLGANTGIFLDFLIITDPAGNYRITTTEPKYPYLWIDSKEEQTFIMEGKFSGSNYPLEVEMGRRVATYSNLEPGLLVGASTLKGVLWPRLVQIPEESFLNKPKGTIVLFKFPVANHSYLVKGFVFN
jgi:hypothetical protein